MALPFPLFAGVAHVTLHANAARVWVSVSVCESSNKCNKNKLQSSSTTPALVMPSHAPSSSGNLLLVLPLKHKRRSSLFVDGRAKRATHYFLLCAFFSFAPAPLWSGHSGCAMGAGLATGGRSRARFWSSFGLYKSNHSYNNLMKT